MQNNVIQLLLLFLPFYFCFTDALLNQDVPHPTGLTGLLITLRSQMDNLFSNLFGWGIQSWNQSTKSETKIHLKKKKRRRLVTWIDDSRWRSIALTFKWLTTDAKRTLPHSNYIGFTYPFYTRLFVSSFLPDGLWSFASIAKFETIDLSRHFSFSLNYFYIYTLYVIFENCTVHIDAMNVFSFL